MRYPAIARRQRLRPNQRAKAIRGNPADVLRRFVATSARAAKAPKTAKGKGRRRSG